MKDPADHQAELNLFYLHFNDAKTFCEMAHEKHIGFSGFYERHVILSTVFASEALINRVLSMFSSIPKKSWERLSIQAKWLKAPLVCISASKASFTQTFDKSMEPYQSFRELIEIRNWFAHPKVDQFVPAIRRNWTITIIEERTRKEVPWIETLKGRCWPQTKIPLNPFELNETHAQKAIEVLKAMMDQLLKFFDGIFEEEWFWEFDLKHTHGETERLSMESLWGGYTPEQAKREAVPSLLSEAL